MMFERFTKSARATVFEAVKLAERQKAPQIGTRHLLVTLAADRRSRAGGVLGQLGWDGEVEAEVLEKLAAADRRAGLSEADVDALAGIGIDVDHVISTVERNWGTDALASQPAKKRPWFGMPFSDAAKKVLEVALRQAVEMGDRHIDDGHILLGLLVAGDPVAHALFDRGITHVRVRALLVAAAAG